MWGSHLCEDLVQPLQGAIEVDLNPAWGGGHVLAMVLRSPALHEAHADGAHLGQLVDHLKAVVDVLGEQGGKLLVVENLEGAAGRDLAHRRWMEAMPMVAVAALHKDAAVAQTFSIHLTTHIVQMNTLSNMSPRVLDGRIAVDIREQTKTEAVMVVGGVGESIHNDAGRGGMEGLPHSIVEFVVSNRAPGLGLCVCDWGHVTSLQSYDIWLRVGVHWGRAVVILVGPALFRRHVCRRRRVSWESIGAVRV